MKILFVIESLGSGGAERQLVGLATQLSLKGLEICIRTYDDKNFYAPLLEDYCIDYKYCKNGIKRLDRIFVLYKEAKKIKPDVIITFLPGANLAFCLIRLLFFYRCPLIVSERNHTLKWNYRSLLTFATYSFADALVANSQSETDNISKHVFYKKKLHTIRNYVDINYFHKEKILNNVSHPFTIICVSRIREYKNVLGFLKAFQIVISRGYDIKLKWYGHNYGDDYYNEVRDYINSSILKSYVEIHGETSDINKVYNSGDVFCLPSFREGYPNVIIEAMSCELPVICSNVCENPYIIEDGENGFLFDPYNPIDIAKSIENIYSLSHEERCKIGKRNRQKVISNNSIDFFVEEYIKLIKQVM